MVGKCKALLLTFLLVSCSAYNRGVSNRNSLSSEGTQTKNNQIELISQLNYTYDTYNGTTKDYSSQLYLSHFLPIEYKNSGIYFENNARIYPLQTGKTRKKTARKASIEVLPWQDFSGTIISFVRRITPGNLSKKKKPRILVIGDSVTSGYGSTSNKKEEGLPNQYWAWAKMLFEMEKIDNGDKPDEYNALFLGSWSGGNYTINYRGVKRDIRARAEGYGGASLQQLFEPILGNDNKPNRFYNEENKTFSVLSYLSKYRTIDDNGNRLVCSKSNPAGERVTGSDGKEYLIGTEINSQSLLGSVDVCTPSIVVINLCHNTTFDNYRNNIGKVVNVLQSELPDTKIVLMTIDETGTLFPADYPNYVADQIVFKGLHEKNAKIYNYLRENVEDEKNGVFVFAAQFVMPTVTGFPTIVENERFEQNPAVIGPHYHPNNHAHEAWGYALYSLIKYLITDN